MNTAHRPVGTLLGIVLGAALLPGLFPSRCRAEGGLFDPGKPPQKRFAFAMDGKPWGDVFKWLSDATGQPVVAPSVPAGKFTFIGPKGRTYTVAEIVDVVNEGLSASKFSLVRRPDSWLVVPANERLNPGLVLSVRAEELPSRGRAEVARVVLPVEGADTKEALAVVNSMLGPHGKALPLGRRLVVTDSVGNLQQIAQVLREAGALGAGTRAPSEVRAVVIRLASLDAARAVEMMKGLFAKGGPAFVADASRNALVVRGTAAQVQEALDAVKALEDTGAPASRTRTFTVEGGHARILAEELSRLLNAMRRNPVEVITPGKPPASPKPPVKVPPPPKDAPGSPTMPIRLFAVGGRLLASSDDPQALQLVQQLVQLHTDAGAGELKTIRLTHGSAVSVARAIDQVFNGRAAPTKAKRVLVVADPGSNALLIRAAPLDRLAVEKLITLSLDVSPGRQESVRPVWVLRLRHASAIEVAAALRDLYGAEKVPVAVGRQSNLVMFRSTEATYREAKKLVEELDIAPPKK